MEKMAQRQERPTEMSELPRRHEDAVTESDIQYARNEMAVYVCFSGGTGSRSLFDQRALRANVPGVGWSSMRRRMRDVGLVESSTVSPPCKSEDCTWMTSFSAISFHSVHV